MAGHSYEKAKKLVFVGMGILALVTLVEVFFSLLGKGHIIHLESGSSAQKIIVLICGLVIIALSVYKAYYIIFEFMHLKYEAKTLARTILLPFVLIIWAIIAFLWEGDYWKEARSYVLIEEEVTNTRSIKPVGGDGNVKKLPVDDHSHGDDHSQH